MIKRRQRQIQISIAVIAGLLVLIMIIEGVGSLARGRTDIEEGLSLITQAENADMNAIESRIQNLENGTNGSRNFGSSLISLKEFFDGTVVVGDSIAAGLVAYDVLNPSSVVSATGASLANFSDMMPSIRELNPRIIFIALGLNDVSNDTLTVYDFVDVFSDMIEEIRAEMPEAKIIVNSLFPVMQRAVAGNLPLARISDFNEALREFCYHRQIAFLNNEDIVQDELFQVDGIHFLPEFYPLWANNMRGAAEL